MKFKISGYEKVYNRTCSSVKHTLGNAQKERHLKEVIVEASCTTNYAEGYISNLRGIDIAKGKPAVDVLEFLPNISRERILQINGLDTSKNRYEGR